MAGHPDRTAQISELAERVRLLWLGDQAITLELPEENAERVLGLAAALDRKIAEGAFPGAGEAVPAIRSVTLHFDPLFADPCSWLDDLMALAAEAPTARPDPREFTLPVCFDAEFAPDLAEIAKKPGYAYMGDVPDICRAPRRKTPRSSVPAGSVAVAGAMCSAYPWNSPGGWNLVGRTPARLFDPSNPERPALLAPGDKVRWKAVSRAEFDRS
jgi:allophanate hydrolase subunit 1